VWGGVAEEGPIGVKWCGARTEMNTLAGKRPRRKKRRGLFSMAVAVKGISPVQAPSGIKNEKGYRKKEKGRTRNWHRGKEREAMTAGKKEAAKKSIARCG